MGKALDKWISGNDLQVGDYICSPNELYFALMQGDGNFVIYHGSSPKDQRAALWATGNSGSYPHVFARLQNDGNFVVYKGTELGQTDGTVFVTNHYLSGPSAEFYGYLQDDGVFVIYRGDKKNDTVWWHSPKKGEQFGLTVTDNHVVKQILGDVEGFVKLASFAGGVVTAALVSTVLDVLSQVTGSENDGISSADIEGDIKEELSNQLIIDLYAKLNKAKARVNERCRELFDNRNSPRDNFISIFKGKEKYIQDDLLGNGNENLYGFLEYIKGRSEADPDFAASTISVFTDAVNLYSALYVTYLNMQAYTGVSSKDISASKADFKGNLTRYSKYTHDIITKYDRKLKRRLEAISEIKITDGYLPGTLIRISGVDTYYFGDSLMSNTQKKNISLLHDVPDAEFPVYTEGKSDSNLIDIENHRKDYIELVKNNVCPFILVRDEIKSSIANWEDLIKNLVPTKELTKPASVS